MCRYTHYTLWNVSVFTPTIRCNEIFRHYYKFSPDSNSEISLKIGRYLTKLRRTKKIAIFGQSCIFFDLVCKNSKVDQFICIFLNFMNFVLIQLKCAQFKQITKFIKVELHNRRDWDSIVYTNRVICDSRTAISATITTPNAKRTKSSKFAGQKRRCTKFSRKHRERNLQLSCHQYDEA